LNRLPLYPIQSYSLGDNPIEIPFACKYAIINESSSYSEHHCPLAQYLRLGNPHYLVLREIHTQNIPIWYIGIQKHVILVLLSNLYQARVVSSSLDFGFWILTQPDGISINLINLMNNIKMIPIGVQS
jgi:hypothetical protein